MLGKLNFQGMCGVIKFMINGKSPGSDGYTVDFYKFFWKDIGPFVFRSLFYGYNSGKRKEKTDNILVIGDLSVF